MLFKSRKAKRGIRFYAMLSIVILALFLFIGELHRFRTSAAEKALPYIYLAVGCLSMIWSARTAVRRVSIILLGVLVAIALYHQQGLMQGSSGWWIAVCVYMGIGFVLYIIGARMEARLALYCSYGRWDYVKRALMLGADIDGGGIDWLPYFWEKKDFGSRDDGIAVRLEDSSTTALMRMAGGCNETAVGALLHFGANPNAQDDWGETALMYVSHSWGGRNSAPSAVDCAVLLLQHGANVMMADDAGWTALHHAAQEGCCELIPVYLKKGASVDIEDGRGKGITPLILAAACKQDVNRTNVIKTLISHGANVNGKDASARTALMYALGAVSGKLSISAVEALLEGGANIRMEDDSCRTALAYAKMLEEYPENGAGWHNDPRDIAKAIKLLEEAEASPDRYVAPPWTSMRSDVAAAPVSNFETQSVTAADSGLAAACREGDATKVNLLLKNGADANRKNPEGSTPLIEAVKAGHDGLICMLCKKGADVDGADAQDMTALMHACAAGRTEAVNTLVELGADVSHIDSQGRTAETLAAASGDKELCLYLRDLLKKC